MAAAKKKKPIKTGASGGHTTTLSNLFWRLSISMHLSTECLQLEQTIVMPNSMTIELVPETERKKRPSNFGSFKESNAVPVVVSLPVSPTHLTSEHRHLRKIGWNDSSSWQQVIEFP